MELNEFERKFLVRLAELDSGDMSGTYWPVGAILVEVGVSVPDEDAFAQSMMERGLIDKKGSCFAITETGKKMLN